MIDYLILFAGAMIGGLAVFTIKVEQNKNLKLLLAFSGSYLFAITALHLIPEVYETGNRLTGVFVLIGFFLQIVLEQFSDGIEHGHMHKHSHQHHHSFPFGIMISLCLHALVEGIPLGDKANQPLLYGIALHHIPAAFALGSVLLEQHVTKRNTLIALILFALMAPIGLWGSTLLHTGLESVQNLFNYLMAIVIGIFLHISTTILFESSVDHRFNRFKTIAIAAGSSLALLYFFLV